MKITLKTVVILVEKGTLMKAFLIVYQITHPGDGDTHYTAWKQIIAETEEEACTITEAQLERDFPTRRGWEFRKLGTRSVESLHKGNRSAFNDLLGDLDIDL